MSRFPDEIPRLLQSFARTLTQVSFISPFLYQLQASSVSKIPGTALGTKAQMPSSSSSKAFSTIKTLAIVVVATFAILITSNGSGVAAASDPAAKCDQECGDHVSPICGSDSVTYLNACHFDRAYCENKELIPMGYGPCER